MIHRIRLLTFGLGMVAMSAWSSVHAEDSEFQFASFSPDGRYYAWTVIQLEQKVNSPYGMKAPIATTLYWLEEPWARPAKQLKLTTSLSKGEWPQEGVARFAFSPDSKRIAILFQDELRVMSLESGITVATRRFEDIVSCPVWISNEELAFSEWNYRASDARYIFRIERIRMESGVEAPHLVAEIVTPSDVGYTVHNPLEFWAPNHRRVLLGTMYMEDVARVVNIDTGKVIEIGKRGLNSVSVAWAVNSDRLFCIESNPLEGMMKALVIDGTDERPKDVTNDVTAIQERVWKSYPKGSSRLTLGPSWVHKDTFVLFGALFWSLNPMNGSSIDIREKLGKPDMKLGAGLEGIFSLSPNGWFLVVDRAASKTASEKLRTYVTRWPFDELREVRGLEGAYNVARDSGAFAQCVSPDGKWRPEFNMKDCSVRIVELKPHLVPCDK